MEVPPRAVATGVHSPLGSHGTYTRYPKATDRRAKDFARALLPWPITPANRTLGFVRPSILPYKANGSNVKLASAWTSRPM